MNLKKIGRIVIIIFTILLLICIALYFLKGWLGINFFDNSMGVNIYMPGIGEDDVAVQKKEIDSKLKNMQSDVEGMTMYDKQEMGLNPYDKDTDNDGLSDNDEINVYGSDPLRKSTAGDFYEDGYKVNNKMDLFVSYDYEGEYVCENIHVDGVKALVNNIDEASIQIFPDYISLEQASSAVGRTVYMSFRITNKYHVPIEIDTANIIKENEISIDDIEVINCESTQFFNKEDVYNSESAIYSIDGSVIKVDYSETVTEKDFYNVILVNKNEKSVMSDFLSAITFKEDDQARRIADEEGLALGTACSFARIFDWNLTKSDKFATIYYYDTGNEAINNRAIALVKNELMNRLCLSGTNIRDTFYEVEKVDYDEIISKYNCNIPLLKDIWKKFEYKEGEPDTFLQAIHSYVLSSNLRPTELEDAKIKTGTKSGFKYDEEIFPFTNFISKRKDNGETIGGHCAAIATITAKAHNGSYVTPTGEWTSLAVGEKTSTAFYGTNMWNLTTDSSNATLMDKNLNDFKTAEFVDSKGKITENSSGVDEFINLADCYLEEYNNYSKKFCDSMNYSGKGFDKYPYYNVNSMMEYIDSGKILVVGFLDCQMGHVVNAYDYEIEGDYVIFSIYDNNHPENRNLKLIIKHSDYPYYMDFTYSSPDHTWTSETTSYYKLIVTDEDMHFVTDVRRLQDEKGNIEAMTHNYDIANREIDKIRKGNNN